MHFGVLQQLCVYIITWNVNTKNPYSLLSIDNVLGIEENTNKYDQFSYDQNSTIKKSCGADGVPDLYVIGLQEVSASVRDVVGRVCENDVWLSKFSSVLSQKDYVLINWERMLGLRLMIFAQRKHLLNLTHIKSEETRRGFLKFWGNKGAISVHMHLYGSSVTFINAHLPAHDDQLNERIDDYNHIINKQYNYADSYHGNNYRHIFDHDYIFWFGDLNFRLTDPTLEPTNIRYMIEQNQLDELFEKDQLSLVRREGKAFQQFNEQQPKFPPTFKFHVGTSMYNMKRRPAWTDRILYRIKDVEDLKVDQLSYNSHPNYKISDHKPVSGEFRINVVEDPYHRVVEFSNIPEWRLDELNLISYTVPEGFVEEDGDWIGIFLADHNDLTNYIAYEYASHTEKNNNIRHLNVEFSDNVNLIEDRDYVLLYIQKSGSTIAHVAGRSNVFKVKKY